MQQRTASAVQDSILSLLAHIPFYMWPLEVISVLIPIMALSQPNVFV